MTTTWRCAACRCSWGTAIRRLAERGLPVRVDVVVCSPECREKYRRRRLRTPPWTCAVCGVGKPEANRRRHARGLAPIVGRTLTCSGKCRAERNRRVRRGEITRSRPWRR